MIALGLDPGFVSFGWAVLRLEHDRERLLGLGVIRTKKVAGKVLKRDDDHRRCAEIARELLRITREWKPDVICAEALAHAPVATRGGMSIPTIATSTSGRAWGLVDMLAEVHQVALLQAAPQTIKKACAGAANASKVEVQAALDRRLDGALGRQLGLIRAKRQHEHASDAVGAVIALLHHDAVRLARSVKQRHLRELELTHPEGPRA